MIDVVKYMVLLPLHAICVCWKDNSIPFLFSRIVYVHPQLLMMQSYACGFAFASNVQQSSKTRLVFSGKFW